MNFNWHNNLFSGQSLLTAIPQTPRWSFREREGKGEKRGEGRERNDNGKKEEKERGRTRNILTKFTPTVMLHGGFPNWVWFISMSLKLQFYVNLYTSKLHISGNTKE